MTAVGALAPTSAEYLRLGGLGWDELEAVWVRGERPEVEAIAGWEFRGLNCGTALHAALPFQKFIKGFYRAPGGGFRGYNVPVVQDGPRAAWVARPRDDEPKRFGFFAVGPVDPESRDNAHLRALLLDYGRAPNPLLDPSKGLRDYVVRVARGSDDLLLGKALYALGPARVPVGFFLLERHRPSSFIGP